MTHSSSASHTSETQLIGSILHIDDDKMQKQLTGNYYASPAKNIATVAQSVLRSTSAPTQLANMTGAFNTDPNSLLGQQAQMPPQEQYRLTPEYYAYYYSQKPHDPRLAPPLLDAAGYTHAIRALQQQHSNAYSSPLLSAQAAYPPLHAFDAAGLSTDSDLLHQASNSSAQHQFAIQDETNHLHGSASSNTQQLQYNAFGASMLLHMPQQSQSSQYSQSPILQPNYYTQPYQYTPGTSEFDSFDLSKRLSGMSMGDGSTDGYSDYSQASSYYGGTPQAQTYRYTTSHRGKPVMIQPSYDQSARPSYGSPYQAAPFPYNAAAPYSPSQYNQTPFGAPGQYNPGASRGRGARGRGRGMRGGPMERVDRPYRTPGEVPSFTQASAAVEVFKQNSEAAVIPIQQCVDQGILLELCVDQFGSRYVQQRLELNDPTEVELCFQHVAPDALRLCVDVFANYVVQKMFEIGNSQQRQDLLRMLSGSLFELATHMYGCRVIQRAIEVSDPATQALIVNELSQHVLQCIRDANGNHVIGKALQCVQPPLNATIIDAFKTHTAELCCHAYGCRVVQRLLEHSTAPQQQVVLSEILMQIDVLAQNQYGNYVVQHILEHGTADAKTSIIRSLKGHYVDLARHKFASNVIEKALQHGSTADRQLILDELVGTGATLTDGDSPLVLLVRDQFGNFVIQKMFDCLDSDQRDTLVQQIRAQIGVLKKLPYAKHILSKVDKYARQYAPQHSDSAQHHSPVHLSSPSHHHQPPLVPVFTPSAAPQPLITQAGRPMSFAAIASQAANRPVVST